MNRRQFLKLAAAQAAIGPLWGCGRSVPPLRLLAQDAVLLAFGDSITFGTGTERAKSYPSELERRIQRRVVNAGVPGETSRAGLVRLPGALEQVRPALMILCHGGNDFLRKLDEGEAENNIRAMVRMAVDQNVEVVLIGVPKPGLLPSTAGFYESIASDFRLPYDDDILKSVLTDNELKSDLVHPNALGYSRIAQAVEDILKGAGAI